ncbi:MAG: DUF5317 domain-containing protein, partial [Clostridia bacterium]|nr:DUF5317 domain-containing protein [Clostridia bacterium]
GWGWVEAGAPYLHAASYVCLFAALAANRHLPGIAWIGAGTLANFLAIVLNGGRMPVSARAMELTGQAHLVSYLRDRGDLVHSLLHDGTVLPILADVLVLPHPFPRPTVFSLGDLLILVGVFVLVLGVMRPRRVSPAPEV